MKDRSQVFFVAGEPSGDLHASELAQELRDAGGLSVGAVGGPRLRAAGADILIDSSAWGAVGIPQALRQLPTCYAAYLKVVAHLLKHPPDLLVPVDFGAFNMRLLRRLGAHGRPRVLYFFPPGSWSRSERDWSDMAQLTDCVATPFSWSEEMLRQQGVNAHFVGHPVVDRVEPSDDVPALRCELGVAGDCFCLGLLAGSRALERRLLGPQMLAAAARLLASYSHLHVLFSPPPSAAGGGDGSLNLAQLGDRATVVTDTVKLLQASDLVLTAFGTATLEAAAALCPMIAVYRGTTGMWLQFRLMKPRSEFYAMPNIIAGNEVVPEFIRPDQTDAQALSEAASRLIQDEKARAAMKERLASVRRALGPPGAIRRTADLALQIMASEKS